MPPDFELSLLLDNLTSPTNVGSLFRLADALGVSTIYLTGETQVPPNRKLSKVARSTERTVVYEYWQDGLAIIRQLKAARCTLVSLEITTQSIDLRRVDFSACNSICLIVGSEKKGIQASILALSDYTVHIPMLGGNSSMNVANASAIALFEITSAHSLLT